MNKSSLNHKQQQNSIKQSKQQFLNIFNTIVLIQQQLDTIRQLLNEQISFNLKDLYIIVGGSSNSINYKHMTNFIKFQPDYNNNNINQQSTHIISCIQSMIRFYNCNTSLKQLIYSYNFSIFSLSFSEFSSLFLNRQNRLLMKMTLQRQSIGTLPNYILNYTKKIINKEIQLHSKLIQFRKYYSKSIDDLIRKVVFIDGSVDQKKFFEYLCDQMKQSNNLNNNTKTQEQIKVEFDIFIRYLKPFAKVKIQKQVIENLLKLTNAQNFTEYFKQISKKKTTKSLQKDKVKKFTDPFIRQQFHDCLTRPKVTDMFSYREIKSIQKHLDRLTSNLKQSQQISSKIQKFKTVIQKNSKKVLQSIKDILWLQKQIQYARIDLNLCPDFYPVLFFECFHKDKQNKIIPSSMEIYFKQFGINIPLNEIYLLFKRYAWHLQGKMDFNSFCSIFDVCESAYTRIQKNRQIKSLNDVNIQTKKNFLILLATIIKNQKKIQMIKNQLQKHKQMNLRDVFTCFDTDQDGYLSITDFRIVWKKYFNIQINKEMVNLLWFRMGYTNQNQIVKYQQFIKEMMPRSKFSSQNKLKKIKSSTNFFNKNGKQNTKKIK